MREEPPSWAESIGDARSDERAAALMVPAVGHPPARDRGRERLFRQRSHPSPTRSTSPFPVSVIGTLGVGIDRRHSSWEGRPLRRVRCRFDRLIAAMVAIAMAKSTLQFQRWPRRSAQPASSVPAGGLFGRASRSLASACRRPSSRWRSLRSSVDSRSPVGGFAHLEDGLPPVFEWLGQGAMLGVPVLYPAHRRRIRRRPWSCLCWPKRRGLVGSTPSAGTRKWPWLA